MSDHAPEPARGKNGLEWVVFAVSLVVVLGTFAVLLWHAFTWPGGGAELRVVLGTPEPQAGGWSVPVQCSNEGGGSAEHVIVEVTLSVDGHDETAELEIERIARGGVGRGFVGFARAPSHGRLAVRVRSYQEP